MLMIKPAMPYLDVLKQAKEQVYYLLLQDLVMFPGNNSNRYYSILSIP